MFMSKANRLRYLLQLFYMEKDLIEQKKVVNLAEYKNLEEIVDAYRKEIL